MAGTSAGALIGGFYASGRSLAHIRAAFEARLGPRAPAASSIAPTCRSSASATITTNYFDLLTGFRDGSLRLPRGGQFTAYRPIDA